MQKKASRKEWPELVISSGDRNLSQTIRRAAQSGILRKIAPKIYTSNFQDSAENIIKRHRYQILGQLFPNGVISHKSAFDGGISPEGEVIINYSYNKTFKIPGLVVRLIRGPGPDSDDTPFLETLFISSRGRAFLENLTTTKTRSFNKNVTPEAIEERLDRIARIYGSEELNKLRDQAHAVALRLNMKKEYAILNKLIGSYLGTQNSLQKTAVGQARARKEPYDPQRIELFAILAAYLQQQEIPILNRTANTNAARINQAFFESYFSNYIEGTVFEIEEAEKIIFENKIITNRAEDSHDILGTYQIVSNRKLMESIPKNGQELVDILKHRHAILMEARKDKMPGQFKETVNRVGNTIFVRPEEVLGTLSKGFELYAQLPLGIRRAAFMMFLIAEIHPFLDGNGRIARILMNAELDVANESRIIIPTVFREDYLLSLRQLSRRHDPQAYVKMLCKAQQFTALLSFEKYQKTLAQLHASHAFMEPNEGKLILP